MFHNITSNNKLIKSITCQFFNLFRMLPYSGAAIRMLILAHFYTG